MGLLLSPFIYIWFALKGAEPDWDPGSVLDLHLSPAQDDPPWLSCHQTDQPGSLQSAESEYPTKLELCSVLSSNFIIPVLFLNAYM